MEALKVRAYPSCLLAAFTDCPSSIPITLWAVSSQGIAVLVDAAGGGKGVMGAAPSMAQGGATAESWLIYLPKHSLPDKIDVR
jgi:hypothetical protein